MQEFDILSAALLPQFVVLRVQLSSILPVQGMVVSWDPEMCL